MRNVKKYEYYNTGPKIGDYVICNEYDNFSDMSSLYKIVSDFINNNVGLITKENDHEPKYLVKYSNVPSELDRFFDRLNCRVMGSSEILHFSKSKEELELKLMSIKYNI
jgi:hypothetical protein